VENSRNVEPLSNYDEQKHLNAVKLGEVEIYENEYRLVEQSLGLPLQFMELSELEQRMVLLFVDKDFIEPYSGKHTENDAFASFLVAFDKKEVSKKIYTKQKKVVGYSKGGEPIEEEYSILNSEQMPLYTDIRKHAMSVWKQANLKEISNSMKVLITNNGYKDDELLKQKIMSDALSSDKSTFTMQNRRLAVDINGMKQPMGLQQINVYLEGGGEKANEIIVKTSGNKVYDLIPPEVEEVEYDKPRETKD